ncbi:MAG: hypothetical protein J7L54_03785 [Elusimicrobia bacterium]|nr:hypothetical protein [Elusimicrobiota bacterium]
MNIKKGEIFIVSGPAEINLKKGECRIVGAHFSGCVVDIPQGKSIPLEAVSDCEAEIKGDAKKIENSTIPEVWDKLVDKFASEKPRIILVLGEVDTGKTFFSTFLANSLTDRKIKISMIDCDVGQSDIGPPGTIGLAVMEKPVVFISEVDPDALFFLGSHSPGLHLVTSVVGLKKLVDKALASSDTVIIDTPGWVQGDGGRLLRTAEIDILNPDKIILLERGKELEHLVKREKPEKIERIHVSKKATSTSDADRKLLREKIAAKYFRNLREISLNFSDVATDRVFLLTGERIKPKTVETIWAERLSGWEGILVVTEKPLTGEEVASLKKEFSVFKVKNIIKGAERNLVVGLADENKDCLGLAILSEIDYANEKFVMKTPLENAEGVRIIQFGSLKVTSDAKEAGFIEPGYL